MFGALSKRVYLDFAATTPELPESRKAAVEAGSCFGNPGSIHAEGVAAYERLEKTRAQIARELACRSGEIVYTSGATESNNLAVLGAARAAVRAGKALPETHWVTSAIEHASVLLCFKSLQEQGAEVTYVLPDSSGHISPQAVERALRPETVLVSVGWANNEIGVVQQLTGIGRRIRAYEKQQGVRILFHSDAGQAPLYRAPVVHALGVDAFSLGAHKLYGPRGIGALFVSSSILTENRIAPILFGGGQEHGIRPGTEDLERAAGFAESFSIIAKERDGEARRVGVLRDALFSRIADGVPGAVVNGDLASSLPHMLNVSIPGVSAEYTALALDAAGVAVSTKSACHEGEEKGSHVVAALAAHDPNGAWRASSALRFSLGRNTRARDVDRAADALASVVARMRAT